MSNESDGSKILDTFTNNLNRKDRVPHICMYAGNYAIIGSDDALVPNREQAIISTDAGSLLLRPMSTNFTEIWIQIEQFWYKKIQLKSRLQNDSHCVSTSILECESRDIILYCLIFL